MSSPSFRSDGPAPAPVSIARGIRQGGDEFWTFDVKLLRTSKGALHAGEASARHDAETAGFTANPRLARLPMGRSPRAPRESRSEEAAGQELPAHGQDPRAHAVRRCLSHVRCVGDGLEHPERPPRPLGAYGIPDIRVRLDQGKSVHRRFHEKRMHHKSRHSRGHLGRGVSRRAPLSTIHIMSGRHHHGDDIFLLRIAILSFHVNPCDYAEVQAPEAADARFTGNSLGESHTASRAPIEASPSSSSP